MAAQAGEQSASHSTAPAARSASTRANASGAGVERLHPISPRVEQSERVACQRRTEEQRERLRREGHVLHAGVEQTGSPRAASSTMNRAGRRLHGSSVEHRPDGHEGVYQPCWRLGPSVGRLRPPPTERGVGRARQGARLESTPAGARVWRAPPRGLASSEQHGCDARERRARPSARAGRASRARSFPRLASNRAPGRATASRKASAGSPASGACASASHSTGPRASRRVESGAYVRMGVEQHCIA